MGEVRDLISTEGAAAARVVGPAEHSRLEEGAIDDQLPAALEQVEQANLALGSLELVLPLHSRPGHSSTLGCQRITRAGEGLLLHQELLPRSFPFLRRHDGWCVFWKIPFQLFHTCIFVSCHKNPPKHFSASLVRYAASVTFSGVKAAN